MLKIIGWTILAILLLILAILIIVLATPFRYDIVVDVKDKNISARVKVHFWLQAVAIVVEFIEKKLNGFLRILFFKKYFLGDKASKKPKNEGEEEKAKDTEVTEGASETTEPDTSEKPEEEKTEEEKPEEEKPEEEKPEETEEPEVSVDPEGEKPQSDETSSESTDDVTVDKKEAGEPLDEKVAAIIDKIKTKYNQLMDKYHKIKAKVVSVKGFLDLPCTRHTLKMVIRMLKLELKSVMPRKVKGYLTIGLDDPQLMGKICMYGGVFYPKYSKTFKLTPVFDEEIIDGHIEIKGRIILGALLGHLLRLLFVADLYRTIKAFKRMNKKGGKHGEE